MAARGQFAALIAELASGGILITDEFPDRRDDDEQIAFRTLVQLDGDVTLSIHAEALARPDFAELFAAHSDHVRAVLEQKGVSLRRLANLLLALGMSVGVVGGGGAGARVGDVTILLLQIPAALVPYAAASLGALLFWLLASVSLRTVLRRWAFARPPLRSSE